MVLFGSIKGRAHATLQQHVLVTPIINTARSDERPSVLVHGDSIHFMLLSRVSSALNGKETKD